MGSVGSTAALLEDGEAPLEQSHPFGGLALSNQRDSRKDRHHALRQEGQAVFATDAIRLFEPLQQLVPLAEMIEDLGANGERPAQIEGMPALVGVDILGIVDLYRLLAITEDSGRLRTQR
jgi:hypothetical protein